MQTFGMMKELKHHIKDEKDVTILSRDSLLDADVFDDEADGKMISLTPLVNCSNRHPLNLCINPFMPSKLSNVQHLVEY